MLETNDTLFVWRHTKFIDPTKDNDFPNINRKATDAYCPFCANNVIKKQRNQGWEDYWQHNCPYCGFNIRAQEKFGFGWHDELSISYLAELSFDDENLTFNELGTHLSKHFSDISNITPRKFESLVADIYRNVGFNVRLTQQSRDGGYDLVIMDDVNGNIAIVECKRWISGKVGIGTVRQLAGVQLETGIDSATIITTTKFTQPAYDFANNICLGNSGYKLNLVDAQELIELLGIYNANLPPLDVIIANNPKETNQKPTRGF